MVCFISTYIQTQRSTETSPFMSITCRHVEDVTVLSVTTTDVVTKLDGLG